MLNIFLLWIYMLQDAICVTLHSRSKRYNVKFLGKIAHELFSVVSDCVMSGSFIESKLKRK